MREHTHASLTVHPAASLLARKSTKKLFRRRPTTPPQPCGEHRRTREDMSGRDQVSGQVPSPCGLGSALPLSLRRPRRARAVSFLRVFSYSTYVSVYKGAVRSVPQSFTI
jgi:hypothetical protein